MVDKLDERNGLHDPGSEGLDVRSCINVGVHGDRLWRVQRVRVVRHFLLVGVFLGVVDGRPMCVAAFVATTDEMMVMMTMRVLEMTRVE